MVGDPIIDPINYQGLSGFMILGLIFQMGLAQVGLGPLEKLQRFNPRSTCGQL